MQRRPQNPIWMRWLAAILVVLCSGLAQAQEFEGAWKLTARKLPMLEFALAFLGGCLERRFRNAGQFKPRERVPRALDDRVVIGFAGGYSLRVDLAVARRQAEVRSPLENR